MAQGDYEVNAGYVRHRYRPLDANATVFAEYVSQAPVRALGHEKITVSSVAIALPSIPAGTRRVVIRPLDQPINFRDDGTDPTADAGFPIFANEFFIYDTEPDANFKMITSAAATGDADVRVAYYG